MLWISRPAHLGETRLVAPALALTRIRKSFGAFQALDGADFEVQRGEVHALLGENGAGKSSLMNVAAGLYTPDSGRIEVDGVEVALSGPRAARAHRIGMVHQHFKLVKRFTVAENILLASPVRRAFKSDLRKIEKEIERQAKILEFSVEPRRRVDTLSVAEQQQAEILKVLIGGAEILVLDEPTAVLTDQESHRLLTTVRELAANGSAVVFVTHKLAEVRDFADRVTVMRSGRTVATADARAMSAGELTKLVIGTDVTQPSRLANANAGQARLYVADLRCAREDGHVSLDGASFVVNAGEIYGIAGVSGNGQTELAEALMGVRTALAGSIEVAGEGNLTATPPQRRRAAGILHDPGRPLRLWFGRRLVGGREFHNRAGGEWALWLVVSRRRERTSSRGGEGNPRIRRARRAQPQAEECASIRRQCPETRAGPRAGRNPARHRRP